MRLVVVGKSGLLPEPSGYAELLEQLMARVRTARRLSCHHPPRLSEEPALNSDLAWA